MYLQKKKKNEMYLGIFYLDKSVIYTFVHNITSINQVSAINPHQQ